MNVLSDKHGEYDLAAVVAITPLIEKNKDGQEVGRKALLYFSSGAALHTDSKFDDAVKAWKGSVTGGGGQS